MIEEEIAKRFSEILKKNDLTPYKYTKNCSVSKNSVYNLVAGKNLGVNTLNSICEDMGINLYSFFSYQAKDVIVCENEQEKALIKAYRMLKKEQTIRLMSYLDAILDEEKYRNN